MDRDRTQAPIDNAKYIIIPELNGGNAYDQDMAKNELIAALIEGYRIIQKTSTKYSVHYVLLKFKNAGPARAGQTQDDKTNEDANQAKTVELEDVSDKPINLDDIPF